jgi:hypothetical protein
MSARRLAVACCRLGSVGMGRPSWKGHRAKDHWTVPAPKTRAEGEVEGGVEVGVVEDEPGRVVL